MSLWLGIWPLAFPGDSGLADWEYPIRGGWALGSVSCSHSIPPDTKQRCSLSAGSLAGVLYFVLCLSDGCGSVVLMPFFQSSLVVPFVRVEG